MKRTVLVFGSISGLIVASFMAATTAMCYLSGDFEGSMLLGYASMIIAFSLIFVATKSFRDKQNGGSISFGKAFAIGLYITLVASTIYVCAWLIDYYVFMPDFMDQYTAHVLSEAQAHGATAAELEAKVTEMETYRVWYQNPLGVILLTYMEVLPVGLLFALASALILKRKAKDPGTGTLDNDVLATN